MAKEVNEFVVQQERLLFHHMLAKNPNYFGNIPGSKYKPVLQLIGDTTYEQITCVGYNPDTTNMEAVFSVKRASGYGTNLCGNGTFEHVRFYLDFHDGAGFIDQGSVAINVHNLPDDKDCKGQSNFPIKYVATLKKKTNHISFCTSPVLPKLRVILSWNSDPPANAPNWHPVWGNVMDCDIQLKPFTKFLPPVNIDLSEFFQLAVAAPHLSAKQLANYSNVDLVSLNPQPLPPSLHDLVRKYDKVKVPASRFAYKNVLSMIKYPSSELTLQDKSAFENLKINVSDIIDQLIIPLPVDTSKANVEYEELECVGLDYNTESLVATIKIKKKTGFIDDLCGAGSKEYISFWVDWDDKCHWHYINTVELKVHDVNMPGDHLCYSVSLPLDATFHRKLCATPNVIRVRSVLSWNTPPSTTDPNKLEYYGNRVDAHVQIKPGIVVTPGDAQPIFNIIGGVDVDHVDDLSGLTKPGSTFAFNGLSVPTAAPFGGEIVVNGPFFLGYKYRIKITNLATNAWYYFNDNFDVVGFSLTPPLSPITTQTPDINHYYDFLPFHKNTLSVLARFTPGTEDKHRVEIEVFSVAGSFYKEIQMDNTYPDVQLQVNDGGDCTHYKKGQTITGHFYVNDLHINSWSFGSTWGGGQSGTSNTPGLPGTAFSIPTPIDAYPCGAVTISASDKTIVDSQSVGHHRYLPYNVCLQLP